MFLADFHVHSNFSDGRHTIPEVVDLFGQRGFGAIAFTDHICEDHTVIGKASAYLGCSLTPATFPLYVEILRSEAERAREQYGMIVLTGFELSKNSVSNHRSAHVLGIGLTQFVSATLDIAEQAKAIREAGGISVAAHPVWTRKIEKQTYHLWNRRRELAQVFDAWEVASGPYLFPEVKEAGLPLLASSDLHHKRQMTSWKTVLECERHPEAILRAVRRQEVDFRFYRETYDARDSDGVVSLGYGTRLDGLRDAALAYAG